MKYLQFIFLLVAVFLMQSCKSVTVNGRYTCIAYAGIAGDEFIFRSATGQFEYYSKTEGSLRRYSAGTWAQMKGKIILDGFGSKSLKKLDIESNITDAPNGGHDSIIVYYKDDQLDPYTKVDLVLDDNKSFSVKADTIIVSYGKLRSVQVKSYLVHDGLFFISPPTVDTLYSEKILLSQDTAVSCRKINLHIITNFSQFFGIQLMDTLIVKNNRQLIWGKMKFNRLRE